MILVLPGLREFVGVITVVGFAVLVGGFSFDNEIPSPDEVPLDVHSIFRKGWSPPRRVGREARKSCDVTDSDSLNEIVSKCTDANLIVGIPPATLDMSGATESQVEQIFAKIVKLRIPLIFKGSSEIKRLDLNAVDELYGLTVVDNPNLESIQLPSLETFTAHEVRIENNPKLAEIKFPRITGLTTEKGGFLIKNNTMLKEIDISQTTDITIQKEGLAIKNNPTLAVINLPTLTKIEIREGGLEIMENAKLAKISSPILGTIIISQGGFKIMENANLAEISFANLGTVTISQGGFEIMENANLAEISFPNLGKITISQGGFEIMENAKLAKISFPKLAAVIIPQGSWVINKNLNLKHINLGVAYYTGADFKPAAGLVIKGNRHLEGLTLKVPGKISDSVPVTIKDNRMLPESVLNDFKQLKDDKAVWNIQEHGECAFPNEVNDFSELDNCVYVDGNLALAATIQGDLGKPLENVTGNVVIIGSNFTDLDFLQNTVVKGDLELKDNAHLCWVTADNITSLLTVEGQTILANPACPTTTTTTTTTTITTTTTAETTQPETTSSTTTVTEEETSATTESVTDPAGVAPGSNQRVGDQATTEESSNSAALIGGGVGGGIAAVCLIGAGAAGIVVFILYKKGRLFKKKKKNKKNATSKSKKNGPKKVYKYVERPMTKEQWAKARDIGPRVKFLRIRKKRRRQKKQLKKRGPAKGFKFPPKLRHTVNRFKYKKGKYEHMQRLQTMFTKLIDYKADKIVSKFIKRRKRKIFRPYEAPEITKKTVKVAPEWWGPEPKERFARSFHATYIGNKQFKKRFIMCQTPNRLTDYDFWSMVIEKKVQAIVGFVAKQDMDASRQTFGSDCFRYYAYNRHKGRKIKPVQTGGAKQIQIKCLRKAYLPPENWRKPKIMKLYTDRPTRSKKEKSHEDRYKRTVLWPMPVRRFKQGQQDFRNPQTGLVYIQAAQCVRVHKLRVYLKEYGIKRTIFHFEMCGWRTNGAPNMRRLFKLVNAVNKFGGTVVVHSPGGDCRAPTFCAIGLMTRQLLMNKPMSSPIRLINKISNRCPGVLLKVKVVFIVICAMFYFTLKTCRKRFAAAHPDRQKAKGKWKICRARIHNETNV